MASAAAAVAAAVSLSPFLKPRPPGLALCNSISCAPSAFLPPPSSRGAIGFRSPPTAAPARIRRLSSASTDDSPQLLAKNGADAASIAVSALLLLAFLGLAFVTVGAVYLAVTDFQQRREAENLVKEDKSRRKVKSGRKARARAGPRGFGQKKIDEDDVTDD